VSLALEGLDDVSCAHGAIVRDRSLAGHARAVEVLDRQSGEARMLCGSATKLCWASGGRWTRFQRS
jgi:hypothetical protein